jgi:NarL family two-component system sensor histidine kinase YdfH
MTKTPVFQQITQFFSIPDQVDAEDHRLSRPFFILLIFVLLFIYSFALYDQPELRKLGRFLAFTFLMITHLVLHWRVIALVQRPDREVPYVVVQSIIALLLVYMLDELGLAFGVVAAMIGESVGILRKKRAIAVLVVIFLLAGMFAALDLSGQNSAPAIWIASIPLVLFVVIFVELYSRQDEARQHARDLLRALESAHQELTQYAAQVQELTLLAERERMAFELHDTLGQGVAGIVLQLEAVKNHLENGRTGRAEQIVSQTMHKARITLADSRAVIDDLRQNQNGAISLTGMITQLVADFDQSSGITIDLNVAQLPADLAVPELVVEHASRIISEALFNIVQHAQAAQISLTVISAANQLEIAVKDDGLGFDPARIGQDGHYGLLGMQQRAQQLGGTCLVVSQPNQGTLIKVAFPLTQQGGR